jgi:starch synthase
VISRLVYQKGVDLAIEALSGLAELDWQALIFGTGDPALEEMARILEGQFPDRVRAVIRFDQKLSRRVYAGADAILIPSRYEPSGLTQMIGMRYGCVPIARATGGLADTISDYSLSKKGTGFLFGAPDPANLAAAIRSAMEVFPEKRLWQGIQRRGMQADFSWDRSARQYLTLYREMLQN